MSLLCCLYVLNSSHQILPATAHTLLLCLSSGLLESCGYILFDELLDIDFVVWLQGLWAPFQFIWLSLCETSTPFVNVRWILHVLGRKDSALYLYNGGLLTLTFLFFRVFVYTFGLYHLYTIYPVLLHSDKPFASKFVVPTFLVVGYMLNLLWSTKILRGLISLIRKRTAKKAQ